MRTAGALVAAPPETGALPPRRAWTAPVPYADAVTADLAPVEAAVPVYANHGRWVVECPDCSSAQLASRADRRFLCCECANVRVGGLWRPVTWPADVAEIEAVLETRPRMENQNWTPDPPAVPREPDPGESPTPEPEPQPIVARTGR